MNISPADKFKPLLNKLTSRFNPPALPDVLVNALKFSMADDDAARLVTALAIASDASIANLPTFLAKTIFGPPKSGIPDSTQMQRNVLKAKLVNKFQEMPQALSNAFDIEPFMENSDILGELDWWAGESSSLTNFVHSAMLARWPSRP